MMYTEIFAVFTQMHTKHIYSQCGLKVKLLSVIPAVQIGTSGL